MKHQKQTCAYLYADGHAVILYEQKVKLGGASQTVEYAVIHEQWTKASLSFKGRLCFSRYGSAAMLDLCKRAVSIKACPPSTENGSENTRKLGLAIGNLSFDFADGSYLYFNYMPDLISGQFTYQPDHTDMFEADRSTWGYVKVAEIKRKPAPKLELAQAA